MIKIYAERVVENEGIMGYRVKKCVGLSQDKLPKLYLNGKDVVVYVFDRNIKIEEKGMISCLYANNFYPISDFTKSVEKIRKAGEHLRACNLQLQKMRSVWSGNLEIKI